jgi:EAL domain-containing protein (putative c-di-GMP-specific phosphodiesterase class I)
MTRHERRHVEAAIRDGAFSLVYQPIVHLESGTLTGVEALCRFDDGRPPDVWFQECEALGLAGAMDLAIIGAAMHELDRLPDGFLALNLSPATLSTPGALLHALRPALDRRTIVLELTEHAIVKDYTVALDALRILRDAGVLLAIDDAGAGYSTFSHILRLRPDIIKLDRSITQGVDCDAGRRALTSALVIFAAEITAYVVAEGIETEAELVALRTAGVGRGQGFWLARPGPLPIELACYQPRPYGDLVPNACGEPLDLVRPDADATTAVVAHDALTSMAAIATAIKVLVGTDGALPQEEHRALCSVMQRRTTHVTSVLQALVQGSPVGATSWASESRRINGI